jgi:hypothetical protein
MKIRLPYAALALAFVLGACESNAPTSTSNRADEQQQAPSLAKQPNSLLSNIAVTGTDQLGRPFTGTLTVTRFALDRQSGTLLVSGVITDAAGNVDRFTNAVVQQLTGTCPILDLDIGAIHLDLLGLVVDLAPIHLDITAESGPGNLLGNLLCALVGLLDNFPATLQQILNIISNINGLLR